MNRERVLLILNVASVLLAVADLIRTVRKGAL